MTSTGTFQGLSENRNSSKVLKPPGGGSSDIFGAGSETNSPRRVKQHQQSQLGAFFNGGGQPGQQQDTSSSNGSSAPETPRSKPGNDSYKRLFGPPDARPLSTPNSKHHMRSNISLTSSGSSDRSALSSPTNLNRNLLAARNNINNNNNNNNNSSSHRPLVDNGDGVDANNGYQHNDVVGGSSCIPRNPVTGDGVDVKPHGSRRMIRRIKDGNPVTGTGYENSAGQQNGTISGSASSAGSEKSSTDSSPSAGLRMKKQRVPPGGFSSGLW